MLCPDAGRGERGRNQLCVAVLGQVAQLPVAETAHVAVSVLSHMGADNGQAARSVDVK